MYRTCKAKPKRHRSGSAYRIFWDKARFSECFSVIPSRLFLSVAPESEYQILIFRFFVKFSLSG